MAVKGASLREREREDPGRNFRQEPKGQRAENGGLDPSWLSLAFLGRPDLQSKGPKIVVSKDLGTSGLKIGAPQPTTDPTPIFSAL